MMRVVQQPDRFISGESGALVRGINGKKPVPPGRKTLASDKGVADLPTLLSNASTFAQIAVLALLGPDRFAAVGVPDEPGTVLLSVSGSATHPAVVECPTGIPLGAVLDICQAPAGDGVLIGGYHGMWLDAETAYQVPIGREGLASAGGAFGSGIVLPIGDGTCPLGEVSRIASYLAGESAGQCGPCKLGLPTIARALAAIVDGSGGIEALDVARRAAATINGRGACGHPDGTTRFVLSALEVFTEDLAAHVFHSSCGRPVRGMLPLPDGPEVTEAKQLMVDWVRCEGHGLCAHLVPELIHLDKTGFPRRPADPGAAVAGEGSAARGADVPRARAPARHRPEEARRRGRAARRDPIPVAAPAARTGLLGGPRSITAGGSTPLRLALGATTPRGSIGRWPQGHFLGRRATGGVGCGVEPTVGSRERGGHRPALGPPPIGRYSLAGVDDQRIGDDRGDGGRVGRGELRPGRADEHRVRVPGGRQRAVGLVQVREGDQGVARRLRDRRPRPARRGGTAGRPRPGPGSRGRRRCRA